MQRTFLYDFQPSHLDPVGGCVVGLSVNAIEDAALREVLQTPGAAFATWSLFDRLLEPGTPGAPFRFLNPLGQAREVKVALSGLFGRFVARAYLETHMNLSFFAHLGPSTTQLNSGKKLRIKKVGTGDLPDWLACSSHLSNLTVAEAKGCHDRPGPGNALQRAWTQAKRVSVVAKGAPVPLKRVAIATRWGSVSGGVSEPMLWVRDPDEPGAEILREDKEDLRRDCPSAYCRILESIGLPGVERDALPARDRAVRQNGCKRARPMEPSHEYVERSRCRRS
jgi:hypothetical protein